jgi:MFS family permease
VRKLGNQRVTAAGAVFMASYPAWMAAADGPTLFLVGSAFGGLGWSMAGGALANYLLEKIPGDDRPAYLAWYNLAINAAVLLGSLLGPIVGRYIGIPEALFLGGALRLVMAIVIWRWE